VNATGCNELHFLIDASGAIIAYQEKDHSWAGALAFSTEELARSFLGASHLEVAEIAAIDPEDSANLRVLVTGLKRRPIRYLLLDLDYRTGACRQVDFAGEGLGTIRERHFVVPHSH
jgi:hypothetical protein